MFTLTTTAKYDKTLRQLLQKKPISAMFPNLRELRPDPQGDWGEGTSDVIRQSLGGSRLEHPTLFLRGFKDFKRVITTITAEITARNPNILSLVFEQQKTEKQSGTSIRPGEQEKLSQFLAALPRLQDLELTKIGGDCAKFWQTASGLRTLKDFVMRDAILPNIPPLPGFPVVRSIQSELTTFSHLPHF